MKSYSIYPNPLFVEGKSVTVDPADIRADSVYKSTVTKKDVRKLFRENTSVSKNS